MVENFTLGFKIIILPFMKRSNWKSFQLAWLRPYGRLCMVHYAWHQGSEKQHQRIVEFLLSLRILGSLWMNLKKLFIFLGLWDFKFPGGCKKVSFKHPSSMLRKFQPAFLEQAFFQCDTRESLPLSPLQAFASLMLSVQIICGVGVAARNMI